MPAGISRFTFHGGALLARLAFAVVICAATTGLLHAHGDSAHGSKPVRVLGKLDFPTSATSPDAQKAFVRGMLLLHLFEYDFARDEFLDAERIEPDFAMAYWGEAMTFNHPIWDQQDRNAGLAALRKLAPSPEARAAAARTPKEKAFLEAIDVLYGDGAKSERDRAYERAMERMARHFADDLEVQLFYALALMGEQAGVRDIPTYMQAAALAQSAFCTNPNHPGAAHYLIHAVDDPDHAVLGLQAARALERMAPDASHSLHMASHIYDALGMWDDVVRANEAATRVRNRMLAERGKKATAWGHANFWLLYGYLQQGRYGEAKKLLTRAYEQERAEKKPPSKPLELDPDDSLTGSVVQMWTRYLVETRDWNGEIANWQFNLSDAYDPNLNFLMVATLRAAKAGRPDQADASLEKFRHLRAGLEKAIGAQAEKKPTDLLYLRRLAVLDEEMQAQIDLARGEGASAVRHAGSASRLEGEMPYSFGPPFIDWPSAEMYAGLLYDNHDYAGAAEAYQTQLNRSHRRPASLLGLARSSRELGRRADADDAMATLTDIWHAADPAAKASM
jgi:tetratricopeptide (TPR) repeat protein